VPGDDPELRVQGLDLRGEHLVVHQEAVREDDRGAVAPGVLEPDPLAVDVGEGHLYEIFTPRGRICTPPPRGRPDDPGYGHTLSHRDAGGERAMIGWLILAALLIPALVLGRWAERERRRTQ